MTGPARPARDLPAWLRAAYGKPLDTTCTRYVVDTAPDGSTLTDSYDDPYTTAAEWAESACRQLEKEGRTHTVTFEPGRITITYIGYRGHKVTTTYTDTENRP